MVIWFAILIPLVGAAALYWIFNHKVMLWECLVMTVVPTIMIAGAKGCSEATQLHDVEYLGGYITVAEYYEDWNERVSCSHPIPCSHPTYSTDANGKRYRSGSKHFNDGHRHLYDVDHHPAYWEAHTSIGASITISKGFFEQIAKEFGNRVFVELKRNYHNDDGDKYVSKWNGEPECLAAITVQRGYRNRIQASKSVFNFKQVNPKDYGLFEYPPVSDSFQLCVLGPGASPAVEKKFQYLNATLGGPRQVRLYTLIFQDQPVQAAMDQEAYWKRGNKNEFVTCIGVDKELAVQWAYVFSWTDSEELKIEARNSVMQMKTLDLGAYADSLKPMIEAKWERKKFEEFDYLTVEPPLWVVIWTYIATLLVTVGIGFWAVLNDIDPDRRINPFSIFMGRRQG